MTDREHRGDSNLETRVDIPEPVHEAPSPTAPISNAEAAARAKAKRKEEGEEGPAIQQRFANDSPPPALGGDDDGIGAHRADNARDDDPVTGMRPTTWTALAGPPRPTAEQHETPGGWAAPAGSEGGSIPTADDDWATADAPATAASLPVHDRSFAKP